MTQAQIRWLGPRLAGYVDEFSDCFKTSQTREHLQHYIKGQLSDLPRKSVEPMAQLAGVPPRTLQEFLSLSDWDHDRMRTHTQQIVARDHADANAIGIVDGSGHPKKGKKTACVGRQWCGATGKVDNCVMGVHLAYASWDNAFRTMIDSDLFVPEDWSDDPKRRREAQIPAQVLYRPKYQIALEQLRRARANGVHLAWLTADQEYGGNWIFLRELESMKQSFVVETRYDMVGWLEVPSERLHRGQLRRHYPPEEGGGRTLKDLCATSPVFTERRWKRFHIKDTNKGPMVWEARWAQWWTEREGKVLGPYRVVVARNVLDRDEIKYFLSNRIDVKVRTMLHVGFSRWPVERCLEDQKSELGMSHFECRKYPAILRHLLLTQVSQLFLARECQRLRGEKSAGHGLSGSHRRRSVAGRADAAPRRSAATDRASSGIACADSKEQCRIGAFPHQNPTSATTCDGHSRRTPDVLRPAMTAKAVAL
jgi:SRSO17 transposase